MSDSKWVNRNLRAGSLPHSTGEPLPTFRREHGRRVSSRPFLMRDRHAQSRYDKKVGARLFIFGVIASCTVLIVALMLFMKNRRDVKDGMAMAADFEPYSIDSGPDPIVHNPAAVVERFLDATSTAELAALAREDDNSPEILDEHADEILRWLEGHREWMPMHEAKANGLLFSVFAVAHISERPRAVYVVQTPSGPRIDIGAFLAWSSESWDDLANGRATSASIFRASVARVSYYNYRFNDETVYRSYRLDPVGVGHSLYGYVVRGTPSAVALEKLVPATGTFPLVISLDDGERNSDRRQFKITRVLAAGWAMGPELIEDHIPQLVDDPALLAPSYGGPGAPQPGAGRADR